MFAASPDPGLLARALRLYLRSGVRGRTRATFLLAGRFESLQAVPITIAADRLYVDLRDGLSHDLLAGSPWAAVPWERDEQQVMLQLIRIGDRVFDIGAHIGLHTVLFSRLVGPGGEVHAFEPNPAKAKTLAVTVSSLPNVRLHPIALGARGGRAALYVPEDQSMASLTDWTGGRVGPVRTDSCEVNRLDDLIEAGAFGVPDFIKCDVEGHELAVFTGARHSLDRSEAPVIFYEANVASARASGAPIGAATDFLRGLERPGYRIFRVCPEGQLEPIDQFDPTVCHLNLVAIPEARLDVDRHDRRRLAHQSENDHTFHGRQSSKAGATRAPRDGRATSMAG